MTNCLSPSSAALRFMRKIIGLKDEFYNRHIIAGNLMAQIVDRLLANNGRYNLLDSAVIELFEFIRAEEIKSLCLYIMDKFWKQLDRIDYVRTFKALRLQYDQHQDRLKDKTIDPLVSVSFTPTNNYSYLVFLSKGVLFSYLVVSEEIRAIWTTRKRCGSTPMTTSAMTASHHSLSPSTLIS
jgi:hypothetical protein